MVSTCTRYDVVKVKRGTVIMKFKSFAKFKYAKSTMRRQNKKLTLAEREDGCTVCIISYKVDEDTGEPV